MTLNFNGRRGFLVREREREGGGGLKNRGLKVWGWEERKLGSLGLL